MNKTYIIEKLLSAIETTVKEGEMIEQVNLSVDDVYEIIEYLRKN